MRTTDCKGCGEPMIWTITISGANMPVNAEPSDDGTFELDDVDPPNSIWVPPNERAGRDLYVCHFVTCPEKERFRRR